ncbi:MAG: hypothetical protein H0V05_17015 [Euzebyaceae bacterium]|jgi:hypothetical protein|nr:hypothetical protein [Euzebyaceae bacterium]
MTDAVRRAIRTYLQAAIGTFLALLTTMNLAPGQVPDGGALKALALAALWSGVPALLSYVHNALEDHGNVPAILKAAASSGQQPLTHDPAV